MIGDTNMRDYEEQRILKEYPVKSCWDIIDPEYLALDRFMATFYRNFFKVGKAGTTRYDKVFCGHGVQFRLFGIFDEAVSPKHPYHFLSDHRALVADIVL